MTTAPRVLDPRNDRATTPPAFIVVGASGVQHDVPAFKFWSREAMAKIDAKTYEEVEEGVVQLLGASAWEDIASTGVNAMYIIEAIKDAAGDAKGEANMGESGGSTTSSEASTATESKPNLPAPTA